MSNNLAQAAIEVRARELWDAREQRFPKFTRLSWDQGSRQAKDIIGCQAFDELVAEGVVRLTDTGLTADGEEL